MSIAISTSVDATKNDFDKIVTRTREVLKDNGFGVLTEIDIAAAIVD